MTLVTIKSSSINRCVRCSKRQDDAVDMFMSSWLLFFHLKFSLLTSPFIHLQDKNQDEWHSAVERYDVITLARISLMQFNGYVSKSEKLCWCILFLSILTETGATTLSKYASDLSSPTLLAMSCVLVILRFVTTKTFVFFVARCYYDIVLLTSCSFSPPKLDSQCGLTISLAKIDVGVAYAMWAAVGTAAVSISAMVLFAEDFDLMKVGCLLMIIVGVAGLNLRDSH